MIISFKLRYSIFFSAGQISYEMKAILLILLFPLFLCVSSVNAQSGSAITGLQGMNYQAVLRKTSTQGVAANLTCLLKFSFSATSGGVPVYEEVQGLVSSAQGIVSAVIGKGTVLKGSWSAIPWSSGTVYLQASVDMTNSGSYDPIGTPVQMFAVPYAMYAANGGSGGTGGSGTGTGISWKGTKTIAPLTAITGDAYYNSTDRKSYIYDSLGVWQVMTQDGNGISWLGQFTVDPSSPVAGNAYYNMTDKKSYIYDGSAWQIMTQDGADGTTLVWLGTLTDAPVSPAINQAYYNSTDKKSYIYDGTGWQTLTMDGIQGVGITWLGSFATAPATPTLNHAYYNTTDRAAYIYDGAAWQVLAEGGTGWTLKTLEFQNNGVLGLATTASSDTLKATKKAWLTTGNTGTNSNTEFIGTLDTAAFAIKTNGNGTQQERIHFTNTSRIFVNGTADTASSQGQAVLTVFGGGSPLALNPGEPSTDHAINAYNSNSTAAIYGRNYSNGYGIQGVSSAGAGIYGWSNTKSSLPIKGENYSSQGGYGIFGSTRSPYLYSGNAYGAGVIGWSQSTAGIGLMGIGNNLDYTNASLLQGPTTNGAGVLGNGSYYGVVGVGGVSNGTMGVGVAGGGNNMPVVAPATGGAGVSGVGYIGVAGFGKSSSNSGGDAGRWGAYFESRYGSTPIGYIYIAGQAAAGTFLGFATTGTKSTIVKDEAGTRRLLYCPEAPEVLFQDYGTGELTNGKAHIDLDKLLTQHILVDAKHPLKVFIQLEGDCNGVFVTNKSATGFDVKELQNGASNVSFTWQIVASRANEISATGSELNYADQRFAEAPGPLPTIEETRPVIDSAAAAAAVTAGKANEIIAAAAAKSGATNKVALKKEEATIVNKAFSNLQFASAKAEIAKSSLSSMDKLATLLTTHPEWHVILSGHTDNEGTPAFNQTLSEKRSEAVKTYLTSKGVNADHITTIGYGQTKPLSAENTQVAREKNRRVEIAIYSERP
ncbi:Outer membrane protein OmpA [Chitinophaga sancti]|uniref:Outer membrane protein OmpA n=2 Tax=Chitinophaga sancti TaxID=1004 RepID=A0A1K1NDK2_9BACT|nr:Outer membrane protein OmpA [Chitinophaga sancti]